MTSINKITLDEVHDFEDSERTLDMYQHIAGKCALYPGQGTTMGLMYVALKMNGEAGEFAEHVGKALRDDGLAERGLVDTRRVALIKEIGDELWYLAAACRELGITLSAAAVVNLKKLQHRTATGALRGSGDER